MAIIQPGGSGDGGGFTNPMTTAGDLIVGGASGAPARLALGSVGTLLGQAASTEAWVFPPGYEIGYDQITSSVTVNSTTESAGNTVIAGSSYTFDGGAVIAEFFAPIVTAALAAGAVVWINLFEGAAQIGRLGATETPVSGINNTDFPFIGKLRFTPTAGAHTYKVTAFQAASSGAGNVIAGALGTGAYVPAYLRFTKV